jgi:hypothetical protein
MLVLYGCAFLLFILSIVFFRINKQNFGNVLVTLALFLNPFGYDLVVYTINSLTNDYWMTMFVMYVLTTIFFSLFMYCYRINPIEVLKYHSLKTHTSIKNKINRKKYE